MSNARQSPNDYATINVETDDSPQRNYPQNDEKIQRLKEHVTEVSNIMQENIEKILDRGSRLDHLEDRSEMLSSHADEFRIGSRNLSRKMWWQNMRINIIIGIVVIVIILIIVRE